MLRARDFLSGKIGSLIFSSFTLFAFCIAPGVFAKDKNGGWIEVRSPHFTVESNSSKAQAKLVALRLEMIQAAMQTVFLGRTSSEPAALKILAVADGPSLKLLMPDDYKQKGEQLAGGFTNTPLGPYIVLRTDYLKPDSFDSVFHEYTHYAMRQGLAGMPLWLAEGLADFYGNTHIQGDSVLLGVADPHDLDLLYNRTMIPVQTLLGVGYDSAYYHDRSKVGMFYAESWALAHYLLMQDAEHGTHRVADYASQVSKGGSAVDTFVQLFGPTQKMDNALTPYVGRATFAALKYPISERLSSKEYDVRPLPPAAAAADQAEFLLVTGAPAPAEKLLKEALATDPRSAPASALMGYLLLRKGNTAQALQLTRQAIQFDPNDYHGYFFTALALNSDHPTAAQSAELGQDLERANALKPRWAVAENLLGVFYLNQPGKLEQAFEWALRAVKEEPENNAYLTDLEVILLKQDNQAGAVSIEMSMLTRAATPRKQAEVRNQIGWRLLQEHVALARADFEIRKANQLAPNNADIVDSLGHLLEQQSDWPGAEDAFRHALALQPNLVSSLEGLGDVLRSKKDMEGAIGEYQKALKIAPLNARVHYGLYLAFQAKGDTASAAKEIQAARALDPYNSQYQ